MQNGPSNELLSVNWLSITVWLPNERRYQPKVTATRGASSCCTLAVYSQLYWRTPYPSSSLGLVVVVEATVFPKLTFVVGPSSPDCTDPSGLKIVKSPLSVHVRVSVRPTVVCGLFAAAVAAASPLTYRAAANLTAVLPVPNRSYETPRRGLRSFQFWTSKPAKCAAGLQRPAGKSSSCTSPWNQS